MRIVRTPQITLPELSITDVKLPDVKLPEFGDIAGSRPLYALAGAGDLAVEVLRGLPTRLAELRAEVPAPREAAAELGTKAEEVYEDLAARGKSVVTRIRRQKATQDLEAQATSTVRRTKAATTTARNSAANTRAAAKGAATSARRTASAAARAASDGAGKVG